jgi:hypothetical protein
LIEFFFGAKIGRKFGLLFNEKSFIEVEKLYSFSLKKKRKSAKNPNH